MSEAALATTPEDRATIPPPVSIGDVIHGKFRIERIIGEGGMGFVAEATHLQLDERVALKFLKREAMAQPEVIARFSQEARAAAKLKSEHVARVLDVGSLNDGTPYMVMEHLVGADLSQVLAEHGPMAVEEAVDATIQACEALAEAHARGIVHRDVKPENLFRVRREDGWAIIKVLDFGISKVALTGQAADVNVGSKQTTTILGTPYYMSPEQLRSTRTVDHRADVWSLGAVLFELLTGATAFRSQDFTSLVAEILEAQHRALHEFRPDVPEGLVAVLDRCLAKEREQRFGNMAELAIALVPFGSKRGRVAAEKSVGLVRSAGMLSDPGLSVPPSLAPGPLDSGGYPASMRGRVQPHSGVVSTTGGTMSRVAMEAPTQAPPPPSTVSRKLVGGLGVVFASAAVVAIVLAVRAGAKPEAVAEPRAAGPSVVAAALVEPPAPKPIVSAPPAPPVVEAPAVATPIASASAAPSAQRTPVKAAPRHAAPPARTAAPAAPSEDLEIRHER